MAQDRFQVRFERSGGLAGASVGASLDSAELGQSEADELRGLLDRVDLGAQSPPPRGADRFQYDITIERSGQSRSVTAYDGSMSPQLKALTDWLLAYARRPKGDS
jgi:hypothetical protein